ncbi:MAG: class I SAM-dependent methyltransferase [Nanoarchaeota archaeon]|nr:class I SAM-dependent methyltransferase [Nanoarchaeota archaeon]
MEDYKEITKESYDKNAEYFSEYFRNVFNLEERKEFSKFIKSINGNKILDLGCGDGEHGIYFKNQGFDVVGIDISESFLRIANEKGLNVLKMDIEDLKFDDNFFDGIWAVTSLLHVPKRNFSNVVNKLTKILKSRGILYVCVKEGEGEGFIIDKNDGSTKRFFAFWEKDEILNYFRDYFDLLDFKEAKVNNTIFLEFFFRKKLSS